MAEGETGDRTEAASPRRLQRAREEGRTPVSREAATLAVLGAGGLALLLYGPAAFGALTRRLAALLADSHRIGSGQAARTALWAAALAASPFLAAAAASGALSYAAQAGLRLSPGKLAPDLGRVSPLAGFKRLFGADGLAETLKALVKVGAVGAAMEALLAGELPGLAAAPGWTMPALLSRIAGAAGGLLLAALGVQLLVAGADLAWVRLRHARSLRMSKFDVRQEQKDTDGDPRVKARFRQLRQARARRRMLNEVRRATVVVTNPTHYAVALAYDRQRHAAPRVVAKGVDSMAARIRAAAAEHRVPLVADPPLARALHTVELDRDIPPELFQAVARIIAYVWGLQARAARRP